jgi:hypothetical protein
MNFLTDKIFSVSIWIWLYFLFSIFAGIFVAIYFFRERIRKKWYELRFPEKLIKIIIHYKSNYFKEYWRLIPDDKKLIIEGKSYNYTDKSVIRSSDAFVKKDKKDNYYVTILGKKYNINDKYKLKKRWNKYPEIHYYFNLPLPINFDMSNKKIEFSSKQMEEMKENDLFAKLLTLDTERRNQILIMIVVIINLLATLLILAKIMKWIA